MTGVSSDTSTVRLGAIGFINTLPIYCGFSPSESVKLHYDSPSRLNRMVGNGELDISPVSSAYYLRHRNELLLLEDLSVSSHGAVESVVFISRIPLTAEAFLTHGVIPVPDSSETSIALLAYLLKHKTGKDLTGLFRTYPASEYERVLANSDCALIIGDEALRATTNPDLMAGYAIYDLATLWQEATGLPFVFAVWVARKNWAEQHPQVLHQLNEAMCESRERFFKEPDLFRQGVQLALAQCSPFNAQQGKIHSSPFTSNSSPNLLNGLSESDITRYFTQCLSYRLTSRHRQALERFGGILETSIPQNTFPPLFSEPMGSMYDFNSSQRDLIVTADGR